MARNFGNLEINRAYERSHPSASATGEPSHEEPDGDEQPPEEVAQEHGPAEHVEIHSHHKDGHVHKSVHHHPDSAHHHVSAIMGEHEHESKDEEHEREPEHKGFAAVPMAE
jgi:hypothetical protein